MPKITLNLRADGKPNKPHPSIEIGKLHKPEHPSLETLIRPEHRALADEAGLWSTIVELWEDVPPFEPPKPELGICFAPECGRPLPENAGKRRYCPPPAPCKRDGATAAKARRREYGKTVEAVRTGSHEVWRDSDPIPLLRTRLPFRDFPEGRGRWHNGPEMARVVEYRDGNVDRVLAYLNDHLAPVIQERLEPDFGGWRSFGGRIRGLRNRQQGRAVPYGDDSGRDPEAWRRIQEAQRREPWSDAPSDGRRFETLPGMDFLDEMETDWSEDGYGLLIPEHELPAQRNDPEGEDDLARYVQRFLEDPESFKQFFGSRRLPVLTSGDPDRRAEYRPPGMVTPLPVMLRADRHREMPVYPVVECRSDEARADEFEMWRRSMIAELYGDPKRAEGDMPYAA